MMRMAQAILMVIIAYPILTNGFINLVHLGNLHVWTEPRAASHLVLTQLRGRVALGRRFFRAFRFLEQFHAAHTLYTSLYSPSPIQPPVNPENADQSPPQVPKTKSSGSSSSIPAEAWLDIFAKTFNGMYLLLESSTTLDAMGISGFSLWGSYWSPVLHIEAQRFWFFALACGVASGMVKLVKLFAYAPVPQTGEGYGTGEKHSANGTAGGEGDEKADWVKERDRLRKIVTARKEARKEWRRNIRVKSKGLVRRMCADFLDLAVPGAVVGWVDLSPGTVGLVMIVTTYLTGLETWEKCGSKLRRGRDIGSSYNSEGMLLIS